MAEFSSDESYAKSIEIPAHEVFQDLRNVKAFSIDIGGSLAKLAYSSVIDYKRPRHISTSTEFANDLEVERNMQLYSVEEEVKKQERLHFVKFETKHIEDCLNFIQQNLLSSGSKMSVIKATGGGAHKYTELLTSKLDVRVEKLDEMHCLISGCNFLLKHIPNECFQYEQINDQPVFQFKNLNAEAIFPYLLVNIGSGVSILKVEGPDSYERIGGTSTGGGTFWGLGSLLTDAKGFDELLDMTTEGKTKNVDMLVRDIYGGSYEKMNLPGDLTASSFGKAARASRETSSNERFRQPDIAKALLRMISNDIGQISALYAQLHGLQKIIFGGYFIRGHAVTMHTISYAVNFFSRGSLKAMFLRHEGYLGAIGAYISSISTPATSEASWSENYAGSSGFPTPRTSSSYDVFQLDKVQHQYEECPLLFEPGRYKPDLIDLSIDESAREYWLSCFEIGITHYMDQAIKSQSGQIDVYNRGENFQQKFLQRLETLRKTPYAFGRLTVRSLLDTRGQFLAAHSFCDPYLQVKQKENEVSMLLLKQRLDYVDTLSDDERHIELIRGLVAGNIFDWGAQESERCFEDPQFGFDKAKDLIQNRPWLEDNVDIWLQRMRDSTPHFKAVVFVDNSGADIILGVFPFVRELLKRGTKVCLAANSYPAINDVIYSELDVLCERVAAMCCSIRTALAEGTLVVMENGLGSPCLDLRRIDVKLASHMKDADLIVLEGMGRCLHTNYNAEFRCESIRCCVIKNEWLAKRFNGDLFDVIFRYTLPLLRC